MHPLAGGPNGYFGTWTSIGSRPIHLITFINGSFHLQQLITVWILKSKIGGGMGLELRLAAHFDAAHE